MEDLDKARTHVMLASTAMICVFGGMASFDRVLELPLLGIKFDNPNLFPWILACLWLYFWQRFTSLSREKFGQEIQALLDAQVNAAGLVRRLFPSSAYGIGGNAEVATRPWLPEHQVQSLGNSHVIYRRHPFARVFEFSYISPALHVHFLDPRSPGWKPHLQTGRVGIFSLRYWRCLAHEGLYLARQVHSRPLVVYYYFPRLLAWAAAISVVCWASLRSGT